MMDFELILILAVVTGLMAFILWDLIAVFFGDTDE